MRSVIIMSKDIMIYCILCSIMAILLIVYCIYVVIDERKKVKYYNQTLLYVTDWDKYCTMLHKQKRIIFYKKIQLLWFKLLVVLKRLIIWN